MPKPEKYQLRTFGDEYHLIPYGQKAAEQRPTLSINESGALLWKALCQGASKERMCSILLRHYADQDIRHLNEDVEDFLAWLEDQGALQVDCPTAMRPYVLADGKAYGRIFQIGGLNLRIFGGESYIHSFLETFLLPHHPGTIDQLVEISTGKQSLSGSMGKILLRTSELIICEEEDSFVFLYLPTPHLVEGKVKKDGSSACFFVENNEAGKSEEVKDALFHALRFSYLVLAQQRGIFALHSSSILYKGKAWLFSASSGTGKSTHAELWRELYHVPILNGDLNLLTIEKGIPTVHGLPWCGTSGIYTKESYPLGGIVFLKQGEHDELMPLSEAEKQLSLYKRLISPNWTDSQLDSSLDFSQKLARQTNVLSLHCTKDFSAAELMKEAIDQL